jgi:hypothetical protein
MQPQEILRDAAAAPASGADQRVHVRHLCGEGVVLRLAIRPEYRAHLSLIQDVSAGGVGLLLSRPLELGSVIAVEVSIRPGELCTRMARVAHIRRHPTPPDAPWLSRPNLLLALVRRLLGHTPPPLEPCWFIGCRFDRPLSADELKQLCDTPSVG